MTGIAFGMAQPYMTEDQRSAGRRPDVLVYTSNVLEEDLTLAGPIWPRLFASTTGTDCDWSANPATCASSLQASGCRRDRGMVALERAQTSRGAEPVIDALVHGVVLRAIDEHGHAAHGVYVGLRIHRGRSSKAARIGQSSGRPCPGQASISTATLSGTSPARQPSHLMAPALRARRMLAPRPSQARTR